MIFGFFSKTAKKYWKEWQEFEVRHGNEDTFREMLRIKRSVQAQYNTQVKREGGREGEREERGRRGGGKEKGREGGRGERERERKREREGRKKTKNIIFIFFRLILCPHKW